MQLLQKDFSNDDIKEFAKLLKEKFEKLGEKFDKRDIAHIGGAILTNFIQELKFYKVQIKLMKKLQLLVKMRFL